MGGWKNEFQRAISLEISKELSTNKNKLNNAFDNGFILNGNSLTRLNSSVVEASCELSL